MADQAKKIEKEKTESHDKKECQCHKLATQLEALVKEKDEFKTKYLRALADYQNYENRVSIQRKELLQTANRDLIIKLLPFLDHLEKAETFIKDASLKLIKDAFIKTLESEGLKEIEVLGKEYDPYNAEVIDLVKGEKDNIVVEVLRKGYEYNGIIIRIAQVKVSKKT